MGWHYYTNAVESCRDNVWITLLHLQNVISSDRMVSKFIMMMDLSSCSLVHRGNTRLAVHASHMVPSSRHSTLLDFSSERLK